MPGAVSRLDLFPGYEGGVPIVPVVPPESTSPGEQPQESSSKAPLVALLEEAQRKVRWNPGKPRNWIVNDLMIAHQIPEKDRPLVESAVDEAYRSAQPEGPP